MPAKRRAQAKSEAASASSGGVPVVPRHPLSNRVPKPKRTKNLVAAQEAVSHRKASMNCFDIILHMPCLALGCEAYLKAAYEKKMREDACGGQCFDEVSIFGRIDEVYLLAYLAGKYKSTVAIMARIRDGEAANLRRVAQFLCYAMTGARVPLQCVQHAVMTESLDRRVIECGNRHQPHVDGTLELFHQEGNVNWASGVYEARFDANDNLESVLHRPTGAVGKK